ncbi:hypothetical protein HELRODRAFT_160414 [Helobdella robusta]|uniref:Phospholipid scramblase n=1 Tax=Helobdella robusta TaxID=6412 RepID=T1EQ80_HELRO|nr:hypothetical protein HELRODRAFT_160414 [Helobdella robusta]ESO06254.1 hypothetical protein HELRODRAFT_160414 [Helobdella robusta]
MGESLDRDGEKARWPIPAPPRVKRPPPIKAPEYVSAGDGSPLKVHSTGSILLSKLKETDCFKSFSKPCIFYDVPPGFGVFLSLDKLVLSRENVNTPNARYRNPNRSDKMRLKSLISYKVYDAHGNFLLNALEDGPWLDRLCCEEARGFEVKFTNEEGEASATIMRAQRKYKNCTCFPCFLTGCCRCNSTEMTVVDADGVPVGTSCLRLVFWIFNHEHDPSFIISGPCFNIQKPLCIFYKMHDKFFIYPLTKCGTLGKISREFGTMAYEGYHDKHILLAEFPMDFDIRVKAVLLAAMSMLEIMYFDLMDMRPLAKFISPKTGQKQPKKL